MKTTQEPLKILVISSSYPRHQDDYAVPWMRETHRRLKEQGHEITVLAPTYKGLKSHLLDGIEVVRFRYAPKFLETLTHEEGATYRVRTAWRQLLALPYVLMGCLVAAWLGMTRRFDAIHVHWPFPHSVIGQVASFFNRCPLVVMSHGAEFALARRKKWIIPFLRQGLRAADLCIANSTDTASRVTELAGVDCEVLPYGTTVNECTREIPPNDMPRVLFTGRLIERKGLEYLLQAVPEVVSKHKAKFIITGDGDQRPKLEALRKELGIEEHVEFVGFLSKE
ncbi:MAG: glycosyltransferase family 4 protein, partial [Planctomycetota bacterium]